MPKGSSTHLPRSVISLICPVFNEEGMIEQFVDAVRSVLIGGSVDYEVLFVDDGSDDDSWEMICGLAKKYPEIRGLRLAQNVGKELALSAGISSARGQAHIPIDVDLQDPPDLIPAMVSRWQEGALHVVARRADRSDASHRRIASDVYFRVMGWLTGGAMRPGIGDFRLLDASLSDRYLLFGERRKVNKQIFSLLGPTPVEVNYVRPAGARRGMSRQTLAKLLDLAVASIGSNTRRLAMVGFVIGVAGQIIGGLLAVCVVAAWLVGLLEIPGQATTIMVGVIVLAFQTSLFSLVILVLSEVLEESKNRPRYFVRETTGTQGRP